MARGLPLWLRQLRTCLQCRRPGFNTWVGKIPWRRKWEPISSCVFGDPGSRRRMVSGSLWVRKMKEGARIRGHISAPGLPQGRAEWFHKDLVSTQWIHRRISFLHLTTWSWGCHSASPFRCFEFCSVSKQIFK